MECRQEYYRQLYSDKIDFVEATLEDVTKQEGANRFLKELGGEGSAILFGKRNASSASISEANKRNLSFLLDRIKLNIPEIVSLYITSGRRLSFENVTSK